MVQLLIITVLWMGIDPEAPLEIELNIFTIIISQIPGALFGAYAVGYIISKGHEAKKLGLIKNNVKLIIAIALGIAGTFGLLMINLFSNIINSAFSDLGLSLIDMELYTTQQKAIFIESDVIWIILLAVLLIVYAISTEIVFRGVLHNTLRQRFEDNINGRLKIILIISLSFSAIQLLFSFPIGLMYFLLNFLMALLLEVLYDITGNLYTTIVANCGYNILLLLIIIYL